MRRLCSPESANFSLRHRGLDGTSLTSISESAFAGLANLRTVYARTVAYAVDYALYIELLSKESANHADTTVCHVWLTRNLGATPLDRLPAGLFAGTSVEHVE